MNRKFVKPWELALLLALACAAIFASGGLVRAQTPMRFQTIGVPVFNSHFAIVPQYEVVRIVAGVKSTEAVQCAEIKPMLPPGVLPWIGLDTLPLPDGRELAWISVLPGGNCQEDFFEVVLK